ncbi:MAG TPA: DUF5695 domain-containing protein [Fimbriimonadaceae bacterium]|nr:DUF5695 domain-containing protein [Fimbriimonadaceae bacterium]
MDDFGVERSELTGALMTMEFGAGGRIQQLWASDPNLPEEGEEFQFVLTPVSFGEEYAEDYWPGTILVGARTHPSDPWILSRNAKAEFSSDLDDPGIVGFTYELPLLPELQATGKFYERTGPVPHIVWDVEIRNEGRVSIEIGELGFPMALNNLYEGYSTSEIQSKHLLNDRVYVHKFVGGAASYLYAQRMSAEPPGLLIFPGDETTWELCTHVPASLNTPFRWEGIPVVYAHSRATVEREGWVEWFNGHTSLILEPGDSRTFQIRFAPADRDRQDIVFQTLALSGRPAMRLLPAAVAPADVGIAVEVGGSTPTRFFLSREGELETDSDDEGGFCFVKPKEPGYARLSFEDTRNRLSHAHLLFIEPIEALIRKRANWIVENQIHDAPEEALHRAILVTNFRSGEKMTEPQDYAAPFPIQGGLSDALFLAEKNVSYPEAAQIEALDRLIDDFLRDDLQNPADDSVGSSFADAHSVALNFGHTSVYPIVFNLYHAMYRVAANYGGTRREPSEYLKLAFRTAMAMFREGTPSTLGRAPDAYGLPGYSRIHELLSDLRYEQMDAQAGRLAALVEERAKSILKRESIYSPRSEWDNSAFEEAFFAARFLREETHEERALRFAFSGRSLAPSWWWYGSDARHWHDLEPAPTPVMPDRGELCLGYTTAANSLMFMAMLDRDYEQLPDAYMRLAFGGLLGVWALVGPEGAASMGYCPDLASKMFGANPLTGDVGLSLFHYLRGAASYVLPSRQFGVFTFGCHFEVDADRYRVKPWDGVGRRIVMRQVGFEVETTFGKIESLELDLRKRWARIAISNPSDRDVAARLRLEGLWGSQFEVLGKCVQGVEGQATSTVLLPKKSTLDIEAKVLE